MNRWLLSLLAGALALTGCTRSGSPNPPSVTPPPATAPVVADPSGLSDLSGPEGLTMPDLERRFQQYLLSAGEEGPARLRGLLERWSQPGPIETDLDGDDRPDLVWAVSVGRHGPGDLFVALRPGGTWQVGRTGRFDLGEVTLVSIQDMTGDGRPELVWSNQTVGAHTASAEVFVSGWTGDRLTHLSGTPVSITNPRVRLEGPELVLQGGTVNSAGAGLAQRPREDRFRWEGGAIRLVDRRFAPSDLGYHRLQDGIAAEQFGRKDDALQAYRDAMDPNRSAIVPAFLEGGPAGTSEVEAAVRAMARFRLALLLHRLKRPDEVQLVVRQTSGPYAELVRTVDPRREPDSACTRAEHWSEANSRFVEMLNAPFGYNNPRWDSQSICGELPRTGP